MHTRAMVLPTDSRIDLTVPTLTGHVPDYENDIERDGALRGTVLLAGSREDFFASEHPLVRGFFRLQEAGAVQG